MQPQGCKSPPKAEIAPQARRTRKLANWICFAALLALLGVLILPALLQRGPD